MHTKHARDCSVAYIIPLNAGSALFKACLQLITLKTRSKSTQNFARFIHRNMNTFEKTFTYYVWHQKERTNETYFNHFVYNCIYAVNMYKGICGTKYLLSKPPRKVLLTLYFSITVIHHIMYSVVRYGNPKEHILHKNRPPFFL